MKLLESEVRTSVHEKGRKCTSHVTGVKETTYHTPANLNLWNVIIARNQNT